MKCKGYGASFLQEWLPGGEKKKKRNSVTAAEMPCKTHLLHAFSLSD